MKEIWEPHTTEEVWDISPFSDLTDMRVEALKKYFDTQFITPSGSRHIEYPPKMGTDDDYLIYLPESVKTMDEWRVSLVNDGWIDCLSLTEDPDNERYKEENFPMEFWGAFRRGETNIVVYVEYALYEASAAATLLCRKLNVKDKDRRIRIFRWLKFNEPLCKDDLSEEWQ
jgi:hypothetical protein